MSLVQIANLRIGAGEPLALIAGPCVIETRDRVLRLAEGLARLAEGHRFPLVFKASFDKANRTRGDSPRGPGLEPGLRILQEVRGLGLAVATDVHEVAHCGPAAEVVDLLQIPAFLCRQTDLLRAAAATGRPVNVKKGQFMAPSDMVHAVDKVRAARSDPTAPGVLLTERGTTFGYGDLVVDMRSLPVLRALAPVVFDGTHAVQRPGTAEGRTGGDRSAIPGLVRAAVAVGVDALFLEVHPRPEEAWSDAATSLAPESLERILGEARRIRDALEEG